MSEAVRKRTGRTRVAIVGFRASFQHRLPVLGIRRWLPLILSSLLLCAALPAAAQTDLRAPEYRIKAAFLYKFGGYVEWPASAFPTPATPLTIGVIDAAPLAAELQTLVNDRTIGGRPVVVRVLQRGEAVDGVHVIFIGLADEAAIAEVLAATRGKAILTVTESDIGFDGGSAINFLVLDGKIRFDVALAPVETRSLKISSRLLAVARKVVAAGRS